MFKIIIHISPTRACRLVHLPWCSSRLLILALIAHGLQICMGQKLQRDGVRRTLQACHNDIESPQQTPSRLITIRIHRICHVFLIILIMYK
jgi:hypothetical protein